MPHSALTAPDALSTVLRTMQLHGHVFCRSQFSAPWSVSFPAGSGYFHVVERGRCWVRTAGARDATELYQGDLLVLARGDGHRLSSARDLLPVPLEEILREVPPAALQLRWGGGGRETHLVCGGFRLEGPARGALLSLLPPALRVPGEGGSAGESLDASLRGLTAELLRPGPGTELVVSRLVDVVLIQALRGWLAGLPAGAGWLGALRDPSIGMALGRLHAEPGRPWTSAALARAAAMSPSAFRTRFTALVGQAPLRYLARWRMQLAASLLSGGTLRAREVAAQVGYDSEAAFSRAFRRYAGESPRSFRRRTTQGAVAEAGRLREP